MAVLERLFWYWDSMQPWSCIHVEQDSIGFFDTIMIGVIAISPRTGEKAVWNLLLKAHILIFSQLWWQELCWLWHHGAALRGGGCPLTLLVNADEMLSCFHVPRTSTTRAGKSYKRCQTNSTNIVTLGAGEPSIHTWLKAQWTRLARGTLQTALPSFSDLLMG